MATVLAVCILGPATRYDGLRSRPTQCENFFVRVSRSPRFPAFRPWPHLVGWSLHLGRSPTDRVVPQRSGGGGLRPLPQWLVMTQVTKEKSKQVTCPRKQRKREEKQKANTTWTRGRGGAAAWPAFRRRWWWKWRCTWVPGSGFGWLTSTGPSAPSSHISPSGVACTTRASLLPPMYRPQAPPLPPGRPLHCRWWTGDGSACEGGQQTSGTTLLEGGGGSDGWKATKVHQHPPPSLKCVA